MNNVPLTAFSTVTTGGALPFVSVVIPTFNRANLLDELLRSLAVQTYPRDLFEVLVVDNGSRDNTDEIVAAFMAHSPFTLRYFKQNNRSAAPSRSHAVSVAQGDIIAFIDDDCVALPQWLEKGVQCLERVSGLVQGKTVPNPSHPRQVLEKTVLVTREGPLYQTCNIFYWKRPLEEVGSFSPEYEQFGLYYGDDTDLAWKVKSAGYSSAFCEDALVYHHVFRMSLRDWLLEPKLSLTWPYLVKKFPVLRQYMFGYYFLLPSTALFDLLVAGTILGVMYRKVFLLLALPYLIFKYREAEGRYCNPLVRLFKSFASIPRACSSFIFLLYGSVRFRSILL